MRNSFGWPIVLFEALIIVGVPLVLWIESEVSYRRWKREKAREDGGPPEEGTAAGDGPPPAGRGG